jgi:general secretion pathway protein I
LHAGRYAGNGFTLIEVLIALAILSIALAATMRATAMATTSAEEVKLRTYATWVAQNRAAELSARRTFPSVGAADGQTDMGGIGFRWTATTSETPNTAFRKVEIAVTRSDDTAAPSDARKYAVLTIYLSRPVTATAPAAAS